MRCEATLSDDGLYRYWLSRRWGTGRRAVFLMLNPSTADAEVDDPTVRRCIGFAKSWGMAGVEVVNLYAYRATDPKELAKCADPVGPMNDLSIERTCARVAPVLAWGAKPWARPRARRVVRRLCQRWRFLWCLGVTQDGSPRHPLYVPSATQLVRYPSEGL